MTQQAPLRLQHVKIAPLVIIVPRRLLPVPLAAPWDHMPLLAVCPFAPRAPQAATALVCARSPPTAIAGTLQGATCMDALRVATLIKASVPRHPLVISVPAAATARHPRTRCYLACRARTPRPLVLYPTRLAAFVPRLHIAPQVLPYTIRAQQVHSTLIKVNQLAPTVRLVNTAEREL